MLTREAKPVTADFVCSATHSGPFFCFGVPHTLSKERPHQGDKANGHHMELQANLDRAFLCCFGERLIVDQKR
jgi:hypothetical protein